MENKPLKEEDFQGYGEEMINMVNTVNDALAENKQLKKESDICPG